MALGAGAGSGLLVCTRSHALPRFTPLQAAIIAVLPSPCSGYPLALERPLASLRGQRRGA